MGLPRSCGRLFFSRHTEFRLECACLYFSPMLYRFRNLIWVSSALLVLTTVGTIGLHLIERWGWFDSFYMVVTTFTTIGYGEIHPLSHQGRIFNVGLIIVGVVLFALLFG